MANPMRRADNAVALENIALAYRQAVFAAGNGPVPVALTSISPTTKTVASAAATLTATGTGFKSGHTITLDGTDLTTTFVNSTSLTASVVGTNKAVGSTSKVDVKEATGGPKDLTWT